MSEWGNRDRYQMRARPYESQDANRVSRVTTLARIRMLWWTNMR